MAKNICMERGLAKVFAAPSRPLPLHLKCWSLSGCLRLFAVETAGFMAQKGAGAEELGEQTRSCESMRLLLILTRTSWECGTNQHAEHNKMWPALPGGVSWM